ncbi:hypothetical protein [Reinekea sp. G2M2-21]|uniref:hypothetical protein n=1 Tax=Reinekea sp. G2M2-21 TaxID=2788942 RepID=UPI0018AB9635|nr:hypothetical protein [Reinekea sp. G2M2-21]
MFLSEKYIEKISEVLKKMEESGDIVITTTVPQNLSQELYESIVKCWLDENTDFEDPIEFSIPYLLNGFAKTICARFGVTEEEAKEIMREYNNYRLASYSPKENAEVYWHHGDDIALRAYYRIKLGNDDLGIEFLDWRKQNGAIDT